MTNYTVHPDSFSSIELRAGESIDSYIAAARRFNSVEAWREYRDGSPETREALRRERNRDNNADCDDDSDRRRTLELLRIAE
jgi:hypothetical protein